MRRPRLLDLFCGDGGAGEGYRRAGFDVVGVDIEPHAYPCGEFIRADALEVLADAEFALGFDVVHASPPCQGYTSMSNRFPSGRDRWPRLIAPVRELLIASGAIYVIENVTGARRELRDPVLLSGGMFGLRVHRPRLFESSLRLIGPRSQPCTDPIGVYGRAPDGQWLRKRKDGTRIYRASSIDEGRAAMGIDWMSWPDLVEAIPPAYTEWIGAKILPVAAERAA